MMLVNEIKLFELLKARIGEKEAEAFVEILETRVDTKFKDAETIFKGDINSLKEYMDKVFATKEDIHNLKIDIEKLRSEFLVVKWMLGVILAGIISLVVKTFF